MNEREKEDLPQMCSMNTEAMKMRDMTRMGTGPLRKEGKKSWHEIRA